MTPREWWLVYDAKAPESGKHQPPDYDYLTQVMREGF